MFDLFAPSHLILLAIAALVLIGPKDLPRVMHAIGKWTGKARHLVGELREGLDSIEQQGQLDELRKEIAALRQIKDGETEVVHSTPTPPIEELPLTESRVAAATA